MKKYELFTWCIICLLIAMGCPMNVSGQINAPASLAAYGGTTLLIDTMAVPNATNKTRVFVATMSANSVFYADVDHSLADPFGTNLFFRTAPGLSASGNHGTPWGIAAHAPSGRLFVSDDNEGLFSCTTNADSFVTNYVGWVFEVLIQGSSLFFIQWDNTNYIFNLHYGTVNTAGIFTENPASPCQLLSGGYDMARMTLAVHPTNNLLYIAFHNTNLFLKSSTTYDAFSGATTFTPFGVSETVSNWIDSASSFRPLVFGPDGRMFFSSYVSGLAMEYVTYSDDDGATWSAPVATTGGQVTRAVGSADSYSVYSGRGISTNKGVSWTEFGWSIPGARVITGTDKPVAPDPYFPQIIYCITEGGAAVTTNSGVADLFDISRGIEALTITDFDVTRSRETAWIAARGVYRATNFSVSPQWSASMWPGDDSNCRSIGLDQSDTNGSTVYVGGFNLYKTTNAGGLNGTNWVRVFSTSNYYGVTNLAVVSAVKANGNTVFAGCYGPYDTKGGLFKSTDGGSNWIEVTLHLGGVDVNDILLTEENGVKVAYVAVARDDNVIEGSGLYRIVNDTVSHEVSDPVSIRKLAMSSSNTIYASGLDTNYSGVVVYQKVGSTTAWIWRTLSLTNYPATNNDWSSPLWCGGIGPVITIGLDSSSNEVPYMTANQYVPELLSTRYGIYYLSSTSSTWQTSSALSYPVGSKIYVIYWDDLVVGTSVGLYGQTISVQPPVTTVLADPVIVDAAGNWYVWFSGSGYQRGGPWSLGGSGTPVTGDFDGDHYADPAVVNSTGAWSIWFSSLGYQMGGPYSLSGSGTPVAADFDGDYYTDPAMQNLGNWYIWFTSLGYQMGGPYYLGGSGTPVAADFDGDLYADPAMVDSTGAWRVWFTSLGYQMGGPWSLGVSGTPVAGDFDGDGYADPAMVNSAGNWYVWFTSLGYQMAGPWNLGVSGTPLAADFDGR